ncbi:MAG: LamG-like jellyroll fold domain-containing protein [archaeon]
MEFVVLMSFMLLIFIATFVVIQDQSARNIDRQTDKEVTALTNLIKNEVELANIVEDGYRRTFVLPDYINGEEYNIDLDGSDLTISYKGINFVSFLDLNNTNLTGYLNKGYNVIAKHDGRVYLNDYERPTYPPEITIVYPEQFSVLDYRTTKTWINISTHIKGICKYHLTDADFDFEDDGTLFKYTGEYNHSFEFSGVGENSLVENGKYTLHYKCKDPLIGYINKRSTNHSFSIGVEPFSVLLESDLGMNFSSENLNLHTFGFAGLLNDITDWRVDETSIAVLNMPFDINTSFSTTDYSTNNIIGTLHGAKWTREGKVGGAYNFNGGMANVGDEDHILLGSDPILNPPKVTIVAWIKVDTKGPYSYIYSNTRDVLEGYRGIDFRVKYNVNSNKEHRLTVRICNNTYTSLSSETQLETNIWYHVAFTYDGTNLILYLDGEEDNRTITKIGIGSPASYPSAIGGLGFGPGIYNFNGTLDEVMMFDYALSPEQINEIYQAGLRGESLRKMVSEETSISETWTVAVTSSDGNSQRGYIVSNPVTIRSNPEGDYLLESSFGTDLTTENLTLNISGLSYSKTNITDWRVDGTSIAVLNMPFDTNDANTAKDYSTYENHGILGNGVATDKPTWTSNCLVGGCYSYDGFTDYISLGNPSELQFIHSDDFTLEAWINTNDLTGTYEHIIGKTYSNYRLMKYHDTISFRLDANELTINTIGVLTTGEWHHIIAVYDASEKRGLVYVNGLLKANNSDSSLDWTSTSGDFQIGTSPGEVYFFNGTIDEAKTYNHRLSPEQIKENYQAGLARHNIKKMVSSETAKGDVWSVKITPNYQTGDGYSNSSNEVTILNSRPDWVVKIPDQTIDEDSDWLIADTDLSAYFDGGQATDADNDLLTFTVTEEFTEYIDCNITGNKLEIKPVANWYGVTNCTIKANDGDEGNRWNTFTITVTNLNDEPTAPIGSEINNADQVGEELIALGHGGTDLEGNVNYKYQFECPSGTIVQEINFDNSYVIGTECAHKTITVKIWSFDGTLLSIANETKTVTVINSAPKWTPAIPATEVAEDIGWITIDEDLNASGVAWATDVDTDKITFSVLYTSSEVECRITGNKLEIKPALDWSGLKFCTIEAKDTYGATATSTFYITVTGVNDPPTRPTVDLLTPNNPKITDELTATCTGSIDIEGDAISYYYAFYDVTGTAVLKQGFSTDYTYKLSSPTDAHHKFRVDCKAYAGGQYSTVRTGTDIETVINSAPEWEEPITDKTITEDSGQTTVDLNLLTTGNGWAKDPDGDAITFSLSGSDVNTVECKLTGNALSVTPGTDWNGEKNCTVTASDGVYGGTAQDTFKITVTEQNDPPSTPSGSIQNDANQVNEILSTIGAGSTDPDGTIPTYRYEYRCGSATGGILQYYSDTNWYKITTDCKHNTIYTLIWGYDQIQTSQDYEPLMRFVENTAPTWSSPIPNQVGISKKVVWTTVDSNLATSGAGYATDIEGDAITFSVFSSTSNIDCLVTVNKLEIRPKGTTGNALCTIEASDGIYGGRTTSTFSIEIINNAPTTPTTLTLTNPIYVESTLTATAGGSTDIDGDIPIYYYEFYNVNDGAIRQPYSTDRTYVIQAADAHNNIRVRAKANDGTVDSSGYKELIRAVSNTAPEWTYPIPIQTVAEDSSWTTIDGNLADGAEAGWATDKDGDTITFSVLYTTSNIECVLSGTNYRILQVRPTPDWSGVNEYCTIEAKDPSGATATSSFYITVTGSNDKPTTPSGSTQNDANQVGETLTTTGRGSTDPDGTIPTYRYEYRCGSATGTILQARSTSNNYLITSACGNKIYTLIWAFDGIVLSDNYETLTRDVSNTAPILTAPPTVSTTTPKTNDIITCNAGTYYDADGDTKQTSKWQWKKNGAVISGQTTNTLALTLSGLDKGAQIQCEEQPYDGTNYGTWYTSNTATIQNTAPTLTSNPTIPSTPKTNDIITCNAGTYYDIDGDTKQTSKWLWYENNVLISGQTSNTLNLGITGLDGGDTIKCKEQPFDGTNYGTWYTSNTATIKQNTLPILTVPPTISLTAPFKTSTLICNAGTYYDADGNPKQTSKWQWKKNGAVISGQTTNTLNLGTITTNHNDQITCEEEPYDGEDYGLWYGSNVATITARKSCFAIYNAGESIGDGTYSIDYNSDGSNDVQVYCNMAEDGWTRLNNNIATSTVAFNGNQEIYTRNVPGSCAGTPIYGTTFEVTNTLITGFTYVRTIFTRSSSVVQCPGMRFWTGQSDSYWNGNSWIIHPTCVWGNLPWANAQAPGAATNMNNLLLGAWKMEGTFPPGNSFVAQLTSTCSDPSDNGYITATVWVK